MRMLLWMTAAALAVTVLWLYNTWHKMDPRQGLARSTRREPTPIRRLQPRLQPRVRQEIEEQVGDFA